VAETPDAPPVVRDSVSVGEGLECPECHDIVIPPGKMSAKAALGLHRKNDHGVASTSPRRHRKKKADTDAPPTGGDGAEPTPRPLRLVTDTASRVGGKKAPTAQQLTAAFAKLYGYASFGVWSMVLDGDPNITTEDQHDAFIAQLAADDQTAIATVRPLARLTAGSKLNQRFGRAVVDNVDVVESLSAIFDQARAARSYFRARAQAGVPGPSPVAAGPPGLGSTQPAGPGPTTAPGETQGVLVTPAMIHPAGATDAWGGRFGDIPGANAEGL